MSLKNFSKSLLPREKALKNGLNSLTDVELIAIFFRTGTIKKSVLILAQEFLENIDGVGQILKLSFDQITKIKGIGTSKALEILAVSELNRRINLANSMIKKFIIKKPQSIYQFLIYDFKNFHREAFFVVLLNKKNEVINKRKLYDGTTDELLIDLKDIFKFVLNGNAEKFICVHNHPSGNPTPSKADLITTKEIAQIAKQLNVPMLDHIVFGQKKIFSIVLNREFQIL